MLPPLVEAGHRVVCPDFVGFAMLDKPTDLGPGTTTGTWSWWRIRGIEDLPRHVTVVVQDSGGPIGLRWAVENEDRVGRLVILNTWLFTGRVSKGFMQWRDFAERIDLPVGFVIQGATATELPQAGDFTRDQGTASDARVEGRRSPVPADRADHRPGRRRRRDAGGVGRAIAMAQAGPRGLLSPTPRFRTRAPARPS